MPARKIQQLRKWVLLIPFLFSTVLCAAEYEPEVKSLSAKHTFPVRWLRGEYYNVDLDVVNKEFMNHYRVDSRFGLFLARGNNRLVVRIREITALAQLERMSKSRLFVESAGDTVSDTVDNISSAIEDPSDMGTGMSRLFKRLGRMAKNAYKKTRSMWRKHNAGEDYSEELASTRQDVAKGLLGVNRAYRELARDLRVDPYTRNGFLRSEIERMANYSAAGSLGVKSIVPVLPLVYGAGYLISVSGLIWNTHPIDLQLQNEKALRRMGFGKRLIQRLLNNDRHTLTSQTCIVESLKRLDGVKGRKVVMQLASQVGSIGDALFYTRLIELFALYHEKRAGLEAIVAGDRIPLVLSTQRRMVVLLPVDYFRWTQSADELVGDLRRETSKYPGHPEFWVGGQISSKARLALGRGGWAVFDQADRRL